MTRNISPDNKPPRGAASKIRRWASEGRTKNAIAKNLGTSLKTLNAWMDRHPALQQAWDDGLEDEHQVIHAGFMKAIKDGNVTAMIFMAKCRHKYRENASETEDKESAARNFTLLLERVSENGLTAQEHAALTGREPPVREYRTPPTPEHPDGVVVQFPRPGDDPQAA